MTPQVPVSRLIRYFFAPYRILVTALIASSIAFVACETLSLVVVYPTIGSLVSPRTVAAVSDRRQLWLLTVFGISYILVTLLSFATTALSDVLSRIITRDFQLRLFRKYLGSDYQYFVDNQQGTILFRMLTAPAYMTVMLGAVPKLIVASARLITVGTVLLLISFKMTLVMIGLGIVFYGVTRAVSNRVVYRNSSRSQQVHEKLNVVANEAVTGIREVKIREVEASWTKQFLRQAAQLCSLNLRNDVFRNLPAGILQVGFIACMLILLLSRGDSLSVRLAEYVPLIGLYFYAFMRLAPAMNEIAMLKILVSERRPYAEAVYNELETASRRIMDGSINLGHFVTSITFEHVSFTYPTRDYTLRDISLTFEKGRTTALVGHSGCGKSTLADLMVRLFDVESGRILIDGRDLRDLQLESWRRRIGYVSQDTFIINASVRDNIAFLSDGLSDQEIARAADAADAHDFIMDLPQQYDTLLGDRGLKLSGGQRQRIAIARALVHKPDILIFDEATSALDTLSEIEVQNAINRIAKDHTVIVIAHRLSTVRKADKIIVLDKGRIVEQGRHDDLIALRGAYFHLYTSQEELKGTPA